MSREHVWNDDLGMFVPVDEALAESVQPIPGYEKPDPERQKQRDRRHERFINEREKRYERLVDEVRAEEDACQGDPWKLALLRDKYSSARSGWNETRIDQSKTSDQRSGTVYIIQDLSSGLYKIGRTNNLNRRMKELGVGKTARLVDSKQVSDSAAIERAAHKRYRSSRLPQTEYFKLPHPPTI